MPNTKSAKKRLRQNDARRMRNRSARSGLRSQIRRVREAVAEGKIEEAESRFRLTAKTLDRAGAHRLIHPNKAARTKSRLQRLIRVAKQQD
jgi:small subunit ribosomal protein S20